MNTRRLKKVWEKRSRKYKGQIEGVLSKSFPRNINMYLDEWMFEQVKKEILSKGKFNGKILDLGCGYGRLSRHILKYFPESKTYGVDISKTYVDLYNKNLSPRGKAITANIKRLPYKNNFFDASIMVTTLMYMTGRNDQEQVISEMIRVLKKGGVFIIIERNPIGQKIVTGAGLVEKIRGRKNKEIEAVGFYPSYISGLLNKKGGLIKNTYGIPIWTLTFPLTLLLSLISTNLGELFLRGISFFESKLKLPLTLSLYISYTGNKK